MSQRKHFRMKINDQPSRDWTIQIFQSFSSENLCSLLLTLQCFLYCSNCVKNHHAKSSISVEVIKKSVSKLLVPSLQMKPMGLGDYIKGCMLCSTPLTPLGVIKLPFPPWKYHQTCLGGKINGLYCFTPYLKIVFKKSEKNLSVHSIYSHTV